MLRVLYLVICSADNVTVQLREKINVFGSAEFGISEHSLSFSRSYRIKIQNRFSKSGVKF